MRVPDTSTPVLVLTTTAERLLQTPLAVARSLGRLGVAVHIAHPGPPLPYDRSRYVAGRFPVCADATDPHKLLSDLLGMADRMDGKAILVPVDDTAALYVDEHADALGERYLFQRRPPELAASLADKAALHRLCTQRHMPTARTAVPASVAEVVDHAAATGFPIVVKLMDPRRRCAKTPSVTIARDLRELLAVYHHASGEDGTPNLVLQEYLPGGAESVWMLNAYFDAGSRCLAAFTGVKLRQCPPETGPTSLGVCRANETVVRQATAFLSDLGYTGIVDLGCRYDPRDRRYKLLDVNPRIGATFRLFVDSEVDVVRAQYLDLTGQVVPPSRTPDGRRWLDEPHDLYASLRLLRPGLGPVAWVRSLHGVAETAWFAADDPAPFVQMMVEAATRTPSVSMRPRTRITPRT